MTVKPVGAISKNVLSVVMATIAVGLGGLLIGVPAASDGAALTVWTGSMEPDIPRGSMVVVRPVNPYRLEPGDVITYQVRPDSPTFVTHRVVEVQADAHPPSVITKGDANPSVDPDPIEMQWIRGRVLVHVPYLGYVGEWVRSPIGVTVVLLLFGGVATAVLGRNVVRELRTSRKREVETSEATTEPGPSIQAPNRDGGQVIGTDGHHRENPTAASRSTDRT